MLTLDGLRSFLKGEKPTTAAPAPAPAPGVARKPAVPRPAMVPRPATVATPIETIDFARRLVTFAGFGESKPWGKEKVLLGLAPGELAAMPATVNVFVRSPFNVLVLESAESVSELLGRSLFKKLEGEMEVEAALERICQTALRGFAHATGKAHSETRPAGIPGGKQTETVVITSIRDDRFDDEVPETERKPVHLLMFATRVGDDESVKKDEGFETFVVRQECTRWEPQLFEEYTERIFKRHFERLGKEEWTKAFVIEEERKVARELLTVATDERGQMRLLGSASAYEKKLQDATFALMEEIARGFGLRAKGGQVLQRLSLPEDHDIAASAEVRDQGKPNPLPGIVIRDWSNRLLGYIVYCLESKMEAQELEARLVKDNRFHNVLVIYPDLKGPRFQLWQGTDRLDGKLVKRGSKYVPEAALITLIARFFVVSRSRMTDPKELAEELAKRARFLRRLAERQLEEEKREKDEEKRHLTALYDAFRKGLIQGMKPGEFADAYAQTMTYGLLSARWISKDELKAEVEEWRKNPKGSPPQFTREYARKHLNSTSPFLQALFEKVLEDKWEAKLAWLLDDIAALLNRVDVGHVFDPARVKSEVSSDPVIHFYEPFLAAYDAKLKKARGVYYTPQPVVSFIVRSVDEVLRKEFGLEDGLASTDTWGDVQARFPSVAIPKGATKDTPFVCILDPATGTGTFLVTVIDTIYATLRARWEREGKDVGAEWQAWVPKYLLPRLNAFELMVASYAIAHLKVSLRLRGLGYRATPNDRVNAFLTNSLEPARDAGLLFSVSTLDEEARAANAVKAGSGIAITVCIGNPPYSKSSSNASAYISALMEDYKTTVRREETQIQALSDDYMKFVRYMHHRIELSGIGTVGVVTNNGFTDGPIFRDARTSLRSTFDIIRLLNLHGDSRKGEHSPSGEDDENVFDIQQGVAVSLFVRTMSQSREEVVADLWGSRETKYATLSRTKGELLGWQPLSVSVPSGPFMTSRTHSKTGEWSTFWRLYDIFGTGNSEKDNHVRYGAGFVTQQDDFAIAFSQPELIEKISWFVNHADSEEKARQRFGLCTTNQWDYARARRELPETVGESHRSLSTCLYRPFDLRVTLFDRNVCTIQRMEIMRQFRGRNIALLSTRRITRPPWNNVFSARVCPEYKVVSHDRNTIVFPCRWFPPATVASPGHGGEGLWNYSPGFIDAISTATNQRVKEEGVVDYLYSILHSPVYRVKYEDRLQEDFPRIPLPFGGGLYDALRRLGKQLIELHTMGVSFKEASLPIYDGDRAVTVSSRCWKEDRISIGRHSCLYPVSEAVWNFHIGGYQVCDKWLKDRKGRTLTEDDILHYRRIVAAIGETIRIMSEIDEVIDVHGGWPNAFLKGSP